ncbi:MAG TPA: hypothetical protein VF824_06200 [Thermoanaerobaculia bacterium]
MIKRALLTLTAVVVLLMPSGPKTAAGAGYRITDNYFSSSTFMNCVGWVDEYCDGSSDAGGTVSYYRSHEKFGCANNFYTMSCQYWDTSTNSWTTMTQCPEPMAYGRLRIPVGPA